MLGRIFTLIGFWAITINLWAISQSTLVDNLRSRLRPLPQNRGILIQSFTNHTQSYIYDQALAIITFARERDRANARGLLKGLESLQEKDGSLYFSYHLDGRSPYPEGGDKRFAGAIAWVALAASHYQHQFESDEFVIFNKKILSYLNTQMTPLEIRGKEMRAIIFNSSDIKETGWNESETIALEHNLDAYAAFTHFQHLNKNPKWNNNIISLKQFILAMWDHTRSHFWSGFDLKTSLINKSEIYLDNQSWSLLALNNIDLKKIGAQSALDLNCETLFVEHEGVKGFMDSKPARRPASSQFVWSEGTAGQVMAMTKLGQKDCRGFSPREFLNSIWKMKKPDGGVAYSTSTTNGDFTTASSVAGTAWLYFAASDFNPFQLKIKAFD